MKIVSARITEMPKGFFDPMPKVFITFENGQEEFLYEFYPDEIMFKENEFIGLTREEAINLKTKKDLAYLRS
jgi:hypothetical protein